MIYDFLFWGYVPAYRLHDLAHQTRSEATQARRDARGAVSEADRTRDQVERLTLATAAMWSLVKERVGITDDELKQRIEELDLLDGKLDGRMGRAPQDCGACGRRISRRHRKCLYCGEPMPGHVLGE